MVGIALLLALSSAGKTAPSAEARARAKVLTVRSIREYNVGQFDRALADVTEAYMLSGLPALLFNLGQCERALGNWSKAELFFRNYLRDSPHAKNRAETETLIAQVRAKAAAKAGAKGVAAAGDKPPPYISSTGAVASSTGAPVGHAVAASSTGASIGTAVAASSTGASIGTAVAASSTGASIGHVAAASSTGGSIGHVAAASSTGASIGHVAAASSTGASIGNVGRGLVPRRHESPLAHVGSPAPLAATAAPISITKAAPRRRTWLAYTGAALLAGAAASGYYAGYGFAGAGVATANGNAVPAALRGPYRANAGSLQTLGVATLLTSIALAAGGVTLLVLGLSR